MPQTGELFPKTSESMSKLSDTAKFFARRNSRRAVRFLDSMLIHYEFYSEIKAMNHSPDSVTKKLLARELTQDVAKGLTQAKSLFNRSYEYDSDVFKSLELDLESLDDGKLLQAYESFDAIAEAGKWDIPAKHKAIISEVSPPRSFSRSLILKHGTMPSSKIANALPWLVRVYKEELQEEGVIGTRPSESNPGSREVVVRMLRSVIATAISLSSVYDASPLSFAYGLDLLWDSVASVYNATPQGQKLRQDQSELESLL